MAALDPVLACDACLTTVERFLGAWKVCSVLSSRCPPSPLLPILPMRSPTYCGERHNDGSVTMMVLCALLGFD